jgi:hypothetical protein
MKVVGYAPRESQRPIFQSPARFLVVDAGRRWGKTITGLNYLLQGACNEGGENWWVAPVFSQSRMSFRKLLSAAKRGNADGAIKNISHSEMRMEFINGSAIHFKSADNPDTLRGEGLKRVVVDEAARVKREVWEEVLRPAVSDTAGRILFISTPKGRNWFYEMWTRGQDPMQSDYASWRFPTADNPKVPATDIEQARQSLPQDVFNQEYLAEFLEDTACVFRNVGKCIGSQEREPGDGSYYAGCDLAKHTDFTVLTILDGNGNQVYFNRLNQLDWPYQKKLIIDTVKRYNAILTIDSTGIGDPIFDDLQAAGLMIEGYKFTQESKKKLIESLMLSFEQKKIKILNRPEQINELHIFEYDIGPSGQVHYSAPEGYHDDCVIGLALANWARENTFMPMIWRVT